MQARTSQKSLWATLVVPSAACSLFLAPLVGWLVGPLAAVIVFGVCLINAVTLGVVVERYRRDASAQLRRPELRGKLDYTPGVFAPLLSEALLQIEELEQQAAAAFQAKTELEARFHLNRRRLQQFTAIADELVDALILTDSTGHPLYANAAAFQLFGVKPASLDRVASRSDLPLERFPKITQVLRQTLERPAAGSRSTEFAADGHDAKTHRGTARSIFDDEGHLIGVGLMISDIRGESEEKRRHAEFVSSVCHELKTPMAGIRANTELLRDGEAETEDERIELCDFIESQVDRLTRLVNNMLNLARIQSGVIKVERIDCELNDVLQPTVETVRQLADEKSISLVTEFSDLYLAVHADKDLLGQAVINLLSNAVKYTPAGGTVRIRSRLDSERVIIEVKDSGMGIPAECLPRLFDRFYRVPENESAAPGTGLGLAFVKYIVADLHNGSIAVHSEVGKGSTFSVSLPFGHRDKLSRQESPKKPVETL